MAGRQNCSRRSKRGQEGFRGLETLEQRKLLAVTASFNPTFGILTVMGDAEDNVISIGRSSAGVIVVNGGEVPITGGLPTIGSTFLVEAHGLAGNDQISVDETNGGMPAVRFDGGEGNDALIGGSGQDVLIGGDGGDSLFGLDGNDRIIWNPGDDTDIVEGGVGADIIQVNGGNDGEQFTTTANGTRVRFDRLGADAFFLDIGTTETLILNMNGGNDSHSATGNLAALIHILVDGGEGDDTILGSNGIDLLLGGAGNDFVDGQQGNDVIFLGAGNDVFQWDPGDGSDVVDGEGGADTLLFNGSNGSEIFDVAANGPRVRFTRNLGNIVMDLSGVERIDLNTFASADIVNVHNVSGTDLTTIDVDLAALGGVGDVAIDNVFVHATAGDDAVNVTGGASGVSVLGLAARVNIVGAELANDRLTVRGLGGNDVIDASALSGVAIQFAAEGGMGNDTLIGSAGDDLLSGQEDHDTLIGGGGDDSIFGDGGNDLMIWNPGHDTDLMEGGDGIDTVQVNGSDDGEQFTTTANGPRVRFDRLGSVSFSLDIGTAESLVINMNGGDDSHAGTGNLAALIQITVDGGEGDDTILGGNGMDVLRGGNGHDFVDGQQGNDLIFLGAGDDLVQWDPGDGSDVIEGEGGFDTLLFNGSSAAELFDVSANGRRVRFTRNIGNIVMDLDRVERLELNTFAGADTITINDPSGTDLSQVEIDLAAVGGIQDAAIDTIVVNGTSGDDDIEISGVSTTAFVSGLPALVVIAGAEAANDSLIVNTLGGHDVIDASLLPAGVIKLTVDGGAGNDWLIGSMGNDILFGGAGDDVVEGGPGNDLAFLGADKDTFVSDPGHGYDTVDGEGGHDTLVFNGTEQGDDIAIFLAFFGVRVENNLNSAGVDLVSVETTDVNGHGGNDVIVAEHGLNGFTRLDLDGGDGADVLIGGDGDDFLRGGAGNDTVVGDLGDDVIVWSAGDGSDVIDGGLGSDRLDFSGSAARDIVLARSINGRTQIIHHDARLSFLNATEIEALHFDLKAGDDHIVFFDLSGDSAVQSALVEGGDGNDVIDAAEIRFDFSASGGDGNDSLIGGWGNDDLQGGAGSDIITGGVGHDALSGGDGNDLLYGGDGDDELRGGEGRDFLLGGAGNDLLDGGPGADSVLDAGIGFDVVPDGGYVDNLPHSAGNRPD